MKALAASLILTAHAVHAALPLVDFDRMGKVAFAGTFAGLDLFQSSPAQYDEAASTLISRSSSGALSRLSATNTGGRISAGCTIDGTFYFAGSFSSIDSISANNIASYDARSRSFSPLGSDGPNGDIEALHCDEKNRQVWVGGSFSSPGASVAIWNTQDRTWSRPPFTGVKGGAARVFSITQSPSSESLFFGGSFIASFQGNGTSLEGNNNSRVPPSAGATPFSYSLVPIPLVVRDIDPSTSSADPRYRDVTNILCPAGNDGDEKSTWTAADGNSAVLTVRTFQAFSAHGVRLGNTFIPNYGTTEFRVTTIPDNTVRTLTYFDPATQSNRTCSNSCPLSTDSSLPYQDFLFAEPTAITGVQIVLSAWVGNGPGLHLMQVLSSGAFAASVMDQSNAQPCYAPNPSTVAQTGRWTTVPANTKIPGTQQEVRVAEVDVGSSSPDPSFSWMPYVSASGDYKVSMLIPGCTNMQNCASRTSVEVSIFAISGAPPETITISQRNSEDATVEIYRGPIVPSDDFTVIINMHLADNPEGEGRNGKYVIVADRISFDLQSPNINAGGNNGSGTAVGGAGSRNSFGFYEWSNKAGSDATQVLPNATETSSLAFGFDLFRSSSSQSVVNAVAHHSSGAIFVAGNFNLSSGAASGARNIAIIRDGAVSKLADDGVNGAVSSLAIQGDNVFVGGSFQDAASAEKNLRNVAVYNIQSEQWSPLGLGVNGAVSKIAIANNRVQIVGNFTRLNTASGSFTAPGLAVWDITTSSWVNNGGFIVGGLSFVGGKDDQQYVAGRVSAVSAHGANGMVNIKNSDNDIPEVNPLAVQLGSTAFNQNNSPNNVARSWLPHLAQLWARQQTQQSLPSGTSPSAPSVLTGAFWRNGSSEVTILGGNFSFTATGSSSLSSSVAIYNQDTSTVNSLQGAQISGVVRSLLVDGNTLYIGGEFTIPDTDVNSFAAYDLSSQRWISGIQSLAADSDVVVRSLSKTPAKQNTVIVAGSFQRAGSMDCESICFLDTSSRQWNRLGDGIEGSVASVVLAGNDQDVLIASGSIALADGTAANVARFNIPESVWQAVGTNSEIPGVVTAIEVNAGNASRIFAAGKSQDGASFLTYWNGANWNTLPSTLQPSSEIAQLSMVPLQNTHDTGDMIEGDRMLLLLGSLADSSFGNASSVLFDGRNFFPYITTTSTSGASGFIAALFHSFSTFSFNQRRFLATGVVILISIAIAAGVVFFIVLIGILWTLFSRPQDKAKEVYDDDEDDNDSTRHRPSSLLEHINAATRTTILGGSSPFATYGAEKEEERAGDESPSQDHHAGFAGEAFPRTETPSEMHAGAIAEPRQARARFSFDGTGEGELPLTAGTEVEILDDHNDAWWLARDVSTGREGVVPAAYLY